MHAAELSQLILQASLKGGLLILLVGLIHWIGREQIPAGWRFSMWFLVLIRLLLPFAPESRMSLFNLTQARPATPEVSRDRELLVKGAAGSKVIPAIAPASSRDLGKALPLTLLSIWAAGFALLSSRSLLASYKLSKQLRDCARSRRETGYAELGIAWNGSSGFVATDNDSRRALAADLLVDCTRQMNIRRVIELIETDAVSSPALHGIVRPKLLVPPGLFEDFDREELRFIFIHELAHLRRGDVTINCLAELVLWIHWFNPLVWLALARMREERELACDRSALSRLQETERGSYGRTILKLIDCFRTPISAPALVGVASRQDEMKRRILMIAAFRKPGRMSLAFAVLIVLLGWASLTDAQTHIRKIQKNLSPEMKATMEALDKEVALDLKEAWLSEVVNAISNQTGVSIRFAPEVESELSKLPKISVTAEKVPGHLVLMESLGSMKLGMKFENGGVQIARIANIRRIHLPEAPEGVIEEEKQVILEGNEEEELLMSEDGVETEHFMLPAPPPVEANGKVAPGDTVTPLRPHIIVKRQVHIDRSGVDVDGQPTKTEEDKLILLSPHEVMQESGKTVIKKSEGRLEIKIHKEK